MNSERSWRPPHRNHRAYANSRVRSGGRVGMEVLRRMWQSGFGGPSKRIERMRKLGVVSLMAVVSCAPAVSTGGGTGGGTPSQTQTRVWPVLTRLHVDLWLHG